MMKNISGPLVSVVMPVLNGEKYLDSALLSIRVQTFKNWELIVVDDCSSDESAEIVKKHAKQDKRIILLTNVTQHGVAASLNKAIAHARGLYVARMDADDVSRRVRLSKQVDFLLKNPDVVAVGTWMEEISNKGKIIGRRKLPVSHKKIIEMMGYAMGMQHPTIMFNRKLIPKQFDWYKDIKYAEDLDLLFRLSKLGKFENVPEFLYEYRIHSDNESLTKIKRTYLSALKVRLVAIKNIDVPLTVKTLVLLAFSLLVLIMPTKITLKFYRMLRS